jgi:hypothetical protein
MGDKKGASLARMRLSLFCNLEKLRFQSVASDKFQRKIQIPMRLSGHSPPQAGGIMVAPPRRGASLRSGRINLTTLGGRQRFVVGA